MPQYLTPGVYVEEVPSGNSPIAGASTSTPGFVGYVSGSVRMPAKPGKLVLDDDGKPTEDDYGRLVTENYTLAEPGVPHLITSWEQYKNTFGDFQVALEPPKNLAEADKTKFLGDSANQAHPEYNNTLAHAVYGFFNNGGTRCWVVRVGAAIDATNLAGALEALRPIEEIALIAVPGVTAAGLKKQIYQYCELTGDRFAILDGMESATVEMTPDAIGGTGLGTSNYAAIYYPWIQVNDPVSGGKLMVPPSGHVAGLYARVDGSRGVHKAPAAEVVMGATGLARRVSRAEQDGLNPQGINIIRNFDGNIKVWGARTLGGDANGEWKYVNVRRTFLYLRKSIDQGTQWAVFEPNTPALWQKIVRNVSAFLTNVWRGGALFGTTPAEAFYVKCDASLNPPEVRDLGQVITEIGVSVVRPAEFVIFRISQWSGPGQ